jgi:hypothetical protein
MATPDNADPFALSSAEPWTHAATLAYLDANPLPVAFLWIDNTGAARSVHPRHKSVTGYGKWLKETPYFPGLYELIHGVLVLADAHAGTVGDADWLASELELRRPPQQVALFS